MELFSAESQLRLRRLRDPPIVYQAQFIQQRRPCVPWSTWSCHLRWLLPLWRLNKEWVWKAEGQERIGILSALTFQKKGGGPGAGDGGRGWSASSSELFIPASVSTPPPPFPGGWASGLCAGRFNQILSDLETPKTPSETQDGEAGSALMHCNLSTQMASPAISLRNHSSPRIQ